MGDALGIRTLGAVVLLLVFNVGTVVAAAVGAKVGPMVSGTIMGANVTEEAIVGTMDGNDDVRRIVGTMVALWTGDALGGTTGSNVNMVGFVVGIFANGTVVGRVVTRGGHTGGDCTGGGTGSLESTVGSTETTTLAMLDGPADGAGLGLSVVVVGYIVGARVWATFPLPLPLPFPIMPFFRDDLDIFPRHADMDPICSLREGKPLLV
jgi:hypothetical protein